MIRWLKNKYRFYNLQELIQNPFLWIYAAYLTIRYVDTYSKFPAIKFNKFVKVLIQKSKGSNLVIKDRLLFQPFFRGYGMPTIISLGSHSNMFIERDFTFGDGIRISLNNNSTLLLKGKQNESGSGITGNSVILVMKYVEIGLDCIVAWDTFITDCDWHGIDGKYPIAETVVGDHVWIGVGVKVLKGVSIGKNSIITANTVLVSGSYSDSSMISGNPGKVIKTDVALWQRDMNFSVN